MSAHIGGFLDCAGRCGLIKVADTPPASRVEIEAFMEMRDLSGLDSDERRLVQLLRKAGWHA